MRIAYCANVRLPTERAHGHQVAQVCDALVSLGHDVEIFAPYRNNLIREQFSAYYKVSNKIRIHYLGFFDPIASFLFPGVLGLWVLNNMFCRRLCSQDFSSFDVLYTRSPALLSTLLCMDKPVVAEIHAIPTRCKATFVRECNACAKVVCLTKPMKDALVQMGVLAHLLSVEPDGVNIEKYSTLPDRAGSRKKFGIPDDAFVVGYAGSLSTIGLSKDVERIAYAVKRLRQSQKTVHALIAGGPDKDAEKLRKSVSQDTIHVVGLLPHDDVLFVYAASDVLVYTAPVSFHTFYRRDTSPLKIFEYMATGKSIIAADIPPLHDVLTSQSALFYPSGNDEKLAVCIAETMNNPNGAKRRADMAYESAKSLVWTDRMQRILASL